MKRLFVLAHDSNRAAAQLTKQEFEQWYGLLHQLITSEQEQLRDVDDATVRTFLEDYLDDAVKELESFRKRSTP